MFNFLKKWLPAFMVIATGFSMIYYYNDSVIFNAYLTGFTGWLVVATDELFPNRKKDFSKNESNI